MSRPEPVVQALRIAVSGLVVGAVALVGAGCGSTEPSSDARVSTLTTTATATPPPTPASVVTQPSTATATAPAGCGLPQVQIVSARRVGRAITVHWAVTRQPPAACGDVWILVTARSLTAAMPAMGARDSNTGGEVPLRDLSGSTQIRDIVGPIMPPYEADVSLFSNRGERVEVRRRVSATDDPSPEQVRAETRRREACQAGAGRVGECRPPTPPGVVDAPLTGVTAGELARAVGKAMFGGSYGDELAVKSVTCTPAWSCRVRMTLNWGRQPISATYVLRSAGRPGCWRVSGWRVTRATRPGTGLPTPSNGCVGDR